MFWRYFIAFVLLLFVLRRQVLGVSRRRIVQLVLVGGFGQALITYLSLRALDFIPVGPLAFLFYTYPAWVALISAATGREDLTLSRLIALAIALTGIVVMVGTPEAQSLSKVGVVLALGTAFLYALYLPVLHRIQVGVPSTVSSFYLILGVMLAFFVVSIFGNKLEMPGSPAIWIYVTLLAVVCTVIAFISLVSGLRILGPVRTSIVATIEPFWTAVLGILLLGEVATRGTIVGGALIAMAVLLLQWTSREQTVVTAK